MKVGRIIAVLMLIGVIALITWIARNTYWDDVSIPMPLQGEATVNPYYAAERFTGQLGIESSWEQVFTRLPTDEVLFVSSWHWTLVEGRRRRLEEWVQNGGRLVVDRSLVGGEEEFAKWSGIERQRGKASAEEDAADDSDSDGDEDSDSEGETTLAPVQPGASPPCHRIRENQQRSFQLCRGDYQSRLVTTRAIDWALRDDGGGIQVLRVKVGKGSVTAINEVPFRYRSFLLGDHPALLVATGQLRRGDTVHFLSEEKQPSLISLMWKYGWPVVVLSLALIGLALWRNSVRFGPLAAQSELARRSLAEQIRGTGQFAVRFGGGKALHAAAVRALDEAAQRRLPAYPRLSTVERVAAIAKLVGIDAAALGPAIHHSGPRRLHELRQAIALIESVRRRLQQAPH